MLAQGRCHQARTREAPGDPHDSRESDPESGEGARGAVRGPRPEDPGGARRPAADGFSDDSSFVKASYFSVWRRLSPAILGGIGRYAGWLCRERPRGTMRASRIAVLSLIGLLLIGAAAVLLLRMPKPATVTDGIAARYPGDVGIETDPEVFFVERFDEGTIASLAARYEDVLNQGDLSFVADIPSRSAASSSLLMTAVGGARSGAHLYKNLAADGRAQDDTVYLRYYVKYRSPFTPHHNGVWMGGANPPLDWPLPQGKLDLGQLPSRQWQRVPRVPVAHGPGTEPQLDLARALRRQHPGRAGKPDAARTRCRREVLRRLSLVGPGGRGVVNSRVPARNRAAGGN